MEDTTGTDQADGPVQIIDNQVSQAVKPGAPQGKYTVVWRVVSSDGHPIEGTFGFTAGGPNTEGCARTHGRRNQHRLRAPGGS